MEEIKTGKEEESNTDSLKSDKKVIIDYLQETYKPNKGIKLIVKHLWHKYYRLNYWIIRKAKGSTVDEEYIQESKFIQVENTPDGYISEELTEKGN